LEAWWRIGDIGFEILHTSLLCFVVFGWLFKRTRRAHIILLAFILISWIGLGYWYGWGYCLLTDVHWDIKTNLGESELPSSFIAYVFKKVLRVHLSTEVVDTLSYGLLLISLVMSIFLNVLDYKRKNS
jgi:hypothetical protein